MNKFRFSAAIAAAQALWRGTILDASLKAGSTRSPPTLKVARDPLIAAAVMKLWLKVTQGTDLDGALMRYM